MLVGVSCCEGNTCYLQVNFICFHQHRKVVPGPRSTTAVVERWLAAFKGSGRKW